MISLRRAEARHHDRRHKREVWRIFDPLEGVEGAVVTTEAVTAEQSTGSADRGPT